MELQHHKFCYSGSDMTFAVFSDDTCRISYIESIEPGARTKWIVV